MNLVSIHGLESCSNHDATIALFEDGVCTVCLPVERITRNKHAINQPVNDDIISKVLHHNKSLNINDIHTWLIPKSWNYAKYWGSIPENKVVFTDEKNHHLAHIAGSFYTSNFDHACCICCDGIGGNGESITLAYATRKDGIKILKTYDWHNSLGIYYETASDIITGRSSEGKFMGLASWGNSKGLHNITNKGSTIEEAQSYLINYWKNTSGYLKDIDLTNKDSLIYKEFASAIQDDLNYKILELVKQIKDAYPEEENLCLSGGTFLNCTSNGILDKSGLFKNIYCFTQPHDEGQAIGKGLYYLEEILHQKTNCNNLTPYLGLSYLDYDYDIGKILKDEITEYVNEEAVIIEKYNENKILNTLKNNGVIAWFEGRSEVGPRALCHRSLLASPHTKEMFEKLSIKIKGREPYRPLAPVCNDHRYTDIFDDPNPENLSQYMLKTVLVKEEWRDKLPAITHIDNTARPQYLKKEVSPRLYHLMDHYYEETGIPCLINTSLNAKGDPIIESPRDLINFLRKNPFVDYCVFNDQYIITIKDKKCL